MIVVLCTVLVASVVLGLVWLEGPDGGQDARRSTADTSTSEQPGEEASSSPEPSPVPTLPGGGQQVFSHGQFLVAYYGTADTASLGVLGEAGPDQIMGRLRAATRPFARPGRQAQPVYELITTVVQGAAGPDGTYSNDISRDKVRAYIAAAHRNKTLLVLDLQPGRSDFLTVAKRWEWALRDPWVGLALDPEWRMGPNQLPARQIGSVSATEVNRVSAWLSDLTARHRLPQKLFLLHQFSSGMVTNPDAIEDRETLAMVQHIDGYGTQEQKLATYHHVARPQQFVMGFKLFYDEDINLMNAARVLQIRPRVRFVSYQ